jgi:DNA primase
MRAAPSWPPSTTREEKSSVTLAPNQEYQSSLSDNTYGFRKCCEAVREAVPIEEVARRYTDLEPFGGEAWFMGRCALPDHEDRNPSFYIYPPGRWWCYGCNRGGDVVDLEFHCGDYGELWEAMIALSLEYGVELPKRPESWYRRQERQRPVRDAINQAKFDHLRRRLFRRFFEPSLLRIEDPAEREAEAALLWDVTAPLGEMMVERLSERSS